MRTGKDELRSFLSSHIYFESKWSVHVKSTTLKIGASLLSLFSLFSALSFQLFQIVLTYKVMQDKQQLSLKTYIQV